MFDPTVYHYQCYSSTIRRVDPGFLERGFICIKVWGFALLSLRKKIFYFCRILKGGGGGGGRECVYVCVGGFNLDPPLLRFSTIKYDRPVD